MKHILNNLSDEEKNSIREQHTGGMKIMNENFSKLLNSKLGDSKPLVSEQVEEMDEQAVAIPPNVKRLMDDVKNNRLTIGDLYTAIKMIKEPTAPTVNQQKKAAVMKQRQATVGQTQPVKKTATQTTPTSAVKAGYGVKA